MKWLIQVVFWKKRLVVVKEILPTILKARLPWGEGIQPSGEAFTSAVPIECTSCFSLICLICTLPFASWCVDAV